VIIRLQLPSSPSTITRCKAPRQVKDPESDPDSGVPVTVVVHYCKAIGTRVDVEVPKAEDRAPAFREQQPEAENIVIM